MNRSPTAFLAMLAHLALSMGCLPTPEPAWDPESTQATVGARSGQSIEPLGQVSTADNGAILDAYRNQQSDLWVTGSGTVRRTLSDDLQGSKHQRFIVDLGRGATILISHNIDLAPRIPLSAGDTVIFRGEYEWNDRGGVVHWTHHDPQGRRQGGWIQTKGRKYD